MKKIVFIVFMISTFGCFYGSFKGLRSGYKKLSDSEKSLIKVITDNNQLESLKNTDTIYSINASHIKEIIKREKEVVIYFWVPHCTTPVCYPLHLIQEKCSKEDQKLIIIMNYFDFEKISVQKKDDLKMPIFVVNTSYYGSDFCNKYRKLFLKDLLSKEELLLEETYYGYFIFKNGKYIKCVDDFLKE